jgi:squalene cyclase
MLPSSQKRPLSHSFTYQTYIEAETKKRIRKHILHLVKNQYKSKEWQNMWNVVSLLKKTEITSIMANSYDRITQHTQIEEKKNALINVKDKK